MAQNIFENSNGSLGSWNRLKKCPSSKCDMFLLEPWI